ncbi:MAG TPA: protein translocase subunit SecD [Terracidiphilus sp.]
MKKNLKGKIAAIVAVFVLCIYGIFGIPSGLSGKALLEAMTKRIHLGLDLQGGVHLILQVRVNEALNAETDNAVASLEQDLKTANVTVSQVYKPDPTKPAVVQIDGASPTSASALRAMLDSKYSNEYNISGGTAGSPFVLTMKPNQISALNEVTVQKAIDTIGERVNSLGVSEPVVQKYGLGENQILIELPGISDMEKVKDIIQSTARLEIHPVVGDHGYGSEQEAIQSVGGALPPEDMLVRGSGTMGAASGDQFYVLQRAAVVAGNDFRSATPTTNANTGQQQVQFTLTNHAGDKFYAYTSANVGRYMAIVMSNTVREVAVIKGAIRDSGVIEGTFSQEEVVKLSKLLETGALPASLDYLEDRTVGASLGADSIRAGVTAAVAGVMVVMIFMLVYYRGAGINADLALIFNLVILLGVMGLSSWVAESSGNGGMSFTLTLPGIAGVILTIGMGVDSNVLIFERIREEIRAGKAASAAVDQGFAHAWVTIVDTHVTTIVSAAILFLFGTGPVKGFAVTLTIGLLANLFTAVYVSRVIFDAHLNKLKPGEMVSI